jgi:hypothetical protein
VHHWCMVRTTLTLYPEVVTLAKNLAEERKITLSEAINSLIKRGLTAETPSRERTGFRVFNIAESRVFGPDEVEKALLEE